jgi:iron complex transport system ATP-binding protein
MGRADVLDISSVTLFRGSTVILRKVSWRVRRGEHWAVIGANGSGKTTLLRIVSGNLWPSEGDVTVLGEHFGDTDIQALRRRIGWVSSFLNDWVPPGEIVLDTVLSGLSATIGFHARPEESDVARAMELLAFLGCRGRRDHAFGTLSQGEKQKVLIARAMLSRPELLILDEVCAGLDLAAREGFLSTLGRLASDEGGPALVFVTHHIEEIIPAISHVLVLKDGGIAAFGPKEEVLTERMLSAAFGLRVSIDRSEGRHWPRMAQFK